MKFFIRNKKGGLQVSINAIVILVMAVVVIGLGITFITGMFESGGGSLIDITKKYSLDREPTYNDEFVIVDEIAIKRGKGSAVSLGIYNRGSSDMYELNVPVCRDDVGDVTADVYTDVPADGKSVISNQDSIAKLDFAIGSLKSVELGMYSCTVQIFGYAFARDVDGDIIMDNGAYTYDDDFSETFSETVYVTVEGG